ncbi:MAG: ABC transporter ATP-binding protein/permease [Lactobacillus sp.]|jgi:ABC-type multidrug transport system fused ATPase/permease subunit|uniref:ABC transporter ATP-binding protein n=1 Tax=Lacticaseibacillus suilingensis TaxID=2799577 RepID=A0ABW4BD00_9LACO|nr:ABC transporter ATP-binding protein [Lacticaseibacillus suilingensis]MCI1893259.1 ABC transporter ATP-binding protein/permease [Lactobacillus sp.]MCI1918043.1 ABC transporter ATP-binding protein/permease [Lactobacillus sp.]MCI1940791.1 ABC transporter ATP-binding protein/permease [Lactobacillus sp.]MCI1971170.1 ABC transporter ATP-binding protein/permease [Lactobacillus sp.]MCI2016403.1 ABC transporter ATP-binding protein/permease [Lactobacillus sp.]
MLKYLTAKKGQLALTMTVAVMAVCGYVGWSFLLQIVVDIATGKRTGSLVAVAGLMVLYMVVMDTVGAFDRYLRPSLKWAAAGRARKALMAQALALSPAAFGEVGVGSMVGKLTKQVDNITESYFGQWLWLFYLGVQIIVATLATISISPSVTLLIVVLTLPSLVFPFLLKKALQQASEAQVTAIDRYTAKATDLLSGFTTLKFALAGQAAARQHDQADDALVAAQTRNTRIQAISNAISSVLNDLTYMAAWFVGAIMVRAGQMDMGQMVVFSTLTGYLSFPMMSLTEDLPTLIGGIQAARQLELFIASPNAKARSQALPQLHAELACIDASYAVGGQTILNHVKLQLTPGQKVLLVGASGSGKTTLVRLLLGEVMPSQGEALLFGAPAAELARHAVYQRIGFMAQAGHVFTGTVRENMSLFTESFTDEAMTTALKRAGLSGWLTAHSLGTMVSADSPLLSGGEKQRLALARIFLRDYSYYIFDELTTGLDPHIAAGLQRDLFDMAQGFLMITHTYNEAAFAQADQIIVLEKGHVIAQGQAQTPAVQAALQQLELTQQLS